MKSPDTVASKTRLCHSQAMAEWLYNHIDMHLSTDEASIDLNDNGCIRGSYQTSLPISAEYFDQLKVSFARLAAWERAWDFEITLSETPCTIDFKLTPARKKERNFRRSAREFRNNFLSWCETLFGGL